METADEFPKAFDQKDGGDFTFLKETTMLSIRFWPCRSWTRDCDESVV